MPLKETGSEDVKSRQLWKSVGFQQTSVDRPSLEMESEIKKGGGEASETVQLIRGQG